MSKTCNYLHKLFNSLSRFTFPFNDEKIPLNGIYVLFEKGQVGHNLDRIVRIGTHMGDNQLRSRLNQHFLLENKDRSIFRKNIGRAILNKIKDPYLKIFCAECGDPGDGQPLTSLDLDHPSIEHVICEKCGKILKGTHKEPNR